MLKMLLIVALPAGSVVAAGYYGTRAWLLRSVLTTWHLEAEKAGVELDRWQLAYKLTSLGWRDLHLLHRYIRLWHTANSSVRAEAQAHKFRLLTSKLKDRNVLAGFSEEARAVITSKVATA